MPGEAQLLWCRAGKLPDYNYGSIVVEYRWCEDVYWHYRTVVNVRRRDGYEPVLRFENLDYQYTIVVDDKEVVEGEGMFTPVVVPLSAYEGRVVRVDCVLHPAPRVDSGAMNRSQARGGGEAAGFVWDGIGIRGLLPRAFRGG